MDSATREDLKRNELGEAVGGVIHYAEDHSKMILKIAGALVAVGIVIGAVVLWKSGRSSGANELLAEALRAHSGDIVAVGAKPDDPMRPTFANEAARTARAKELFTKLDEKYGSSSVGAVAKLYLADMALEANDTAGARQLWTAYLDAEKSGPMAAAARVNLWKLDRADGKAQTVADEIGKLLTAADKPMPDDVLLFELAVSQAAAGQTDEAKATYRRIVDEHPSSPYFATAQREAGPAPAAGAPKAS